MTDEEIAEYNRLCDEYNHLVAQNRILRAEIENGVENCLVLAGNVGVVARKATSQVKYVAGELNDADGVVDKLYRCLVDVTEHYFLFKNLSEASKKLTQYNDEYYTKFKFYNELRRITLGYVIGLDSHIISNEVLRKKVEKNYLANTDYWLSYAIMSVMLWASDEKEAAYRALNKAMSMDCYKACVFYMLVNLRFGRLETARNWYLTLLEKTDVGNMTDEWQYVLQAYLSGSLEGDDVFNAIAKGQFEKLLEQTKATNADFSQKVHNKSRAFAGKFLHTSQADFPTLSETCSEYKEMKQMLSTMEKIGVMAQYYDDIFQKESKIGESTHEQIENVLYNLINSYDEQEFKIIKGMKLNEAILAAKGDMAAANEKYLELYGDSDQRKTFGDLMIKWAFAEDYVQTDISVKRFAMSYLKDNMKNGMTEFFKNTYSALKESYTINIGACHGVEACQLQCNENTMDSAVSQLTEHYNKNKKRFIFADKYTKIFILMCVASVFLIGVAALCTSMPQLFTALIIIGIVLGIVSGFLLWRRCVDLDNELAENRRLAILKLRNALDEMSRWRAMVNRNYKALSDLQSAVDRF